MPVVDHRPQLARGDEQHERSGRVAGLLGGAQGLADVVGGVGGAGGVGPGAVEDDVAVADGLGDSDRCDGGRGPELAVGAEDLVLRPLLEERGGLEDVGGGE
ncbi:hypothetical protein ACH40E_02460 [Streptomyces acidicola]|uniref:hypothetical protein n=1 Tax=Streptomyces acidicola TaxID=2596892 RepID=UPI0037ABAE96